MIYLPRRLPQRMVVLLRRLLLVTIVVNVPTPIQAFTTTVHPFQRSVRHSSVLSATQQLTLGMGCFWKPSEALLQVPGVQDTIVGYTGHSNPNVDPPSYEQVCFSREWVEAVRVLYDDTQLSCTDLLEQYWNFLEPAGSRQYAPIVFVENAQQEKEAKAWLQSIQNRVRKDGFQGKYIRLEQASPFFKAEEYHQRYWQKTRPRIATMIALLALGSGSIDRWIPSMDYYQSNIHTAANALVLAGLLYVLVERKIGKSVKLNTRNENL